MCIRLIYYTILVWVTIFCMLPTSIMDPTAQLAMLRNEFPKLTREIYFSVYETSRIYHIDPVIILSIIKYESNFNQYAISPKGACGLMQVMPVHNVHKKDIFDCYVNIQLGTKYFIYCYTKSRGDLHEAIRMYNAGAFSDARAYKNWKYVYSVYTTIISAQSYQERWLSIK